MTVTLRCHRESVSGLCWVSGHASQVVEREWGGGGGEAGLASLARAALLLLTNRLSEISELAAAQDISLVFLL